MDLSDRASDTHNSNTPIPCRFGGVSMLLPRVICVQDLDAAGKKNEGELEMMEGGTRNESGSEARIV